MMMFYEVTTEKIKRKRFYRNYIKNRDKIRAQQKEYYKKRKEAKLWKLL